MDISMAECKKNFETYTSDPEFPAKNALAKEAGFRKALPDEVFFLSPDKLFMAYGGLWVREK